MLDDIRRELRINNNELDNEIDNLINSAIEDLKTSGVASSYFDEKSINPMIKTAIITYCKSHFGYDNPEALRFAESYELQKQKLAISHHDFKKMSGD